MPKIVDHEEQRKLIAAAVMEWIAAHGVDTLSQRNVAALAGRSKGNVQHYFPDKASLMFGALRYISGEREVRERLSDEEPKEGPSLNLLRRRLSAVLPTNSKRADEWRVRLSLYVYANRDAEMQAYLANHAEQVLARGTEDVRAAQEHGSVRGDLDPRLTFQKLSAVVSGIAVAELANGGRLSPEEQHAILEEALQSIAA